MDRSLKEANNVRGCGKSFEIKKLKMHFLVLYLLTKLTIIQSKSYFENNAMLTQTLCGNWQAGRTWSGWREGVCSDGESQ